MKKQYLISLLGIATLSFPIGTSLLSKTSLQFNSINNNPIALNSNFNNKETYAKNNGQYNVE